MDLAEIAELVEAEIHQRQHQHRDDHAIHALRGLRRNGFFRRYFFVALDAVGRQFEYPGEGERGNEADGQHDNNGAWHPIGRAEHGQDSIRDLRDQPRTDQIQPGHADDIAAAQFVEKAHGLITGVITGRVLPAQIGRAVLVPEFG